MAKLISKNTPKNQLKVKKLLENNEIVLKNIFIAPKKMSLADALIFGDELMAKREYALALDLADQLLSVVDSVIDIFLLKLRALAAMEFLVEGKKFASQLLAAAPENLGVLMGVARFEMIFGNAKKALVVLARANKLSPNNPWILCQLATNYNAIGATQKSYMAYKEAYNCIKNLKGHDEQKITAMIGMATKDGWSEENKQNCMDLLEAEGTSPLLNIRLMFSFAEGAKKEKNVEKEIVYLETANSMLEKYLDFIDTSFSYDRLVESTSLNMKLFDSTKPAWIQNYSSKQKAAPIFILAMPRSGTTLQEQMLSSHTQIGQTGESKAFPIGLLKAVKKTIGLDYSIGDYPRGIDRLSNEDLDEIGEYYSRHQKFLTEESVYVDKELSSFKYVGLAAHIFPKAKFIHMNREPLDIFLSCYRGNMPGAQSTCSMENMAYVYIEMKKLIGHWKRIYPDRVHIVDYTALVEAPETIMRETMAFLNLEWEDSILEFHKRKNVVRTLSVNQVRKGIYKTSVKKWKPFQEMLQPAIDVLEKNGIGTEGCQYL